MKGPSPLLGYNTNVRHKGKLYHIQTEDSGLRHPHIITHLFADGGRIIASSKTSYDEHIGADDYQKIVKDLMKGQHKAMFIALRDGVYDEDDTASTSEPRDVAPAPPPAAVPPPPPRPPVAAAPPTASAPMAAAAAAPPKTDSNRPPRPGAGRYQSAAPAEPVLIRPRSSTPVAGSIFGGDLLSEKSLDEVILSYLADDLAEAPEE